MIASQRSLVSERLLRHVLIDPRNYEEFYYGEGRGARKDAHEKETSDTDKVKRIRAIQKEGLSVIKRVIARNLSKTEAQLVEKTLLWKLGKWTTNIATGHFADKFRPNDKMHRELPGFDFQNGLYYYNIGEGPHRDWDDYVQFGFISAGQGVHWRNAMLRFHEGDIFAAYLQGRGFVGVGRILSKAVPIRDVKIKGRPLLNLPLQCKNMAENCNNPERSEYVCLVQWLATVPREKPKWQPKSKLYTTQLVQASLDGQPKTVEFLEHEFGLNMRELLI